TPLADEPPAPPNAVIQTASTTVSAGTPLQLDSSGSTPGGGAIVGHLWDLDGNGTFETDTGGQAVAQTTPKIAGPLTVQVRVIDDRGQSGDAKLDLTVTPPPERSRVAGHRVSSYTSGADATRARTSTAPALVPPKNLRHATTTVLAASTSSGGGSNSSGGTSSGSGSGSTSPSSSSSSSSSSGSNLPHTGLDIAVIVLIAMCMTGSGAALRRALD